MERDLASVELWERSLERSRRRRAQSKSRVTNVQVSAALIAASVAVPATGGTAMAQTLERGHTGDDVRAVQRALGISADGEFGPMTRQAVKDFQARSGLVVDGIVGPMTKRALGLAGAPAPSASKGVTPSNATTTMAIQRALGIGADGVYGPVTRQAVRDFQRSRGLVVDGVAGPATLGALGVSGSSGTGGGGGSSSGSAVGAAQTKLGAPYLLGGEGEGGWDCSGLTQWALAQAGVTIPRTSFDQFNVGTPVARESIQAGDLVFFDANGPGASHVGIATGNATVISATTHGVREHAIGGDYWGTHYVGARRF
ncbi:peptidoglycan-binding protein [Solirubrobacter phytolaccae]|uniref:Peptidoglycan-binding protein n=1 Tax=Solirubrobacter phytolaccae TaxID=1404360 RepID=A0A9X3S9A6_9ACTN|nr:peptidoglycan-binding protein [Solirubrobacter phytolaccae]MDA0181266.1 peptidoglycan-binding protein [Solirubrobacter phytolaccae]